MKLVIKVRPRARRSQVLRADAEAVEIALAAPPVDGAANDELVRFVAERLGIPRRRVRIVRGETSRHKQLEIDELELTDVLARLASL